MYTSLYKQRILDSFKNTFRGAKKKFHFFKALRSYLFLFELKYFFFIANLQGFMENLKDVLNLYKSSIIYKFKLRTINIFLISQKQHHNLLSQS